MTTGLDLFTKIIEGLIQDNNTALALDKLLEFEDTAQTGLHSDLILMKGRLKSLNDNVTRGFYDPTDKEYRRELASINYSITGILQALPQRVELYAKVRGLNTYQFDVSDKEIGLEKIIGSADNLLKINWLEKALQASKAVCKVLRADGDSGTGFLSKDGYLFTNNHVLDTPEIAAGAVIQFNFEESASGNAKPLSEYKLDASDFKTSPVEAFDFTRVKVLDSGNVRLGNWGYLEFETGNAPAAGQGVTIIQHPKGGEKRIALRANEVLGQQDQHLYYTTDTEPGSSGSPVFNQDWKVVALHHAARSFNGRDANEGVLFKNILDALG